MGNKQDFKEQTGVSANGTVKVSCDAAAVLLLRLRARCLHEDNLRGPSHTLKYRSHSGGTDEKKYVGARPELWRAADRDPQKAANIFRDIVQMRGWESPLAVGAVTARWAEFVGNSNAAHSYVEDFTDSKVIVRCDSTVWANSLKTMKKNILEIFNREVGKNVVNGIEILGPKGIPNWGKGSWSAHGRGPRDTYG